MSVAGKYECVTRSPMGDQTSILTIEVDGDSFSGSNSGPMGNMAITGGSVDGNTISWSSDITVPMPMKLDCKATIEGDELAGTVTAGMFGSFPMTGKRIG
ncbi:MAG: hypothetical protein WCL10_12525 [Novosphingobium sp.]|uniref:hypothetical protein n=1 Tax=Novosphingobium sp. TaxID=1874826 RepID=UPI003019CCBA